MPRVIVLGAGFGGLAAARSLRRVLNDSAEVVVVSESSVFVYRPALPLVPLGQRSLEDISFNLPRNLARSQVNFIGGKVTDILPAENSVVINGSRLAYDYLIVTLGSAIAFDELPGLSQWGHVLCEASYILRLKETIASFRGGTICLVLCVDNPFELVDIGFIFLLEDHLRRTGLRAATELAYFTPNADVLPFLGERARNTVRELYRARGIGLYTDMHVEEVTPGGVRFTGNGEFPSALNVFVPPYRGREAVRNSGMAGDRGYIEVNAEMQSLSAENIYAAGDIVDGSGPKSARKAIAQAKVAANNVAVRLGRRGSLLRFQERENRCFVDLGGHRAMYLGLNGLGKPNGDRIWIGWMPYVAKLTLEKLYLMRKGGI